MPAGDAKWDLLLLLVSLNMLVSVAHIHLFIPILQPLKLGVLTAAGGVGLYLVNPGVRARLRFPRPHGMALLGIGLWAVAMVPAALHQGMALETITGPLLWTSVMFFLIVVAVRGPRDLQRLCLVYLLGTVFYSINAVRQAGAARDTWRLVEMTGYYDGNDFALFFVTGVPLAVHFIRNPGPIWKKMLAAVGLVSLVAGIILSGSRGGLLALAVAGAFILFKFATIRPSVRIAGLAVILIVAASFASDDYLDRMRTMLNPSSDYNSTEDYGRLQIWGRGMDYFAAYPITGVGANNFQFADGVLQESLLGNADGASWFSPHNTYLQVLTELGLPGFLLFMTLVIACWKGVRRLAKEDPDAAQRSLGQALTALLAAMLVGTFFLSHAYNPLVYAPLALGAAAARIGPARTPRARHSRQRPSPSAEPQAELRDPTLALERWEGTMAS